MGDMGSLLKQAQQMQRELERTKAELAEHKVEGTAGGRAVVITMMANRSDVQVEFSADALKDAAPGELAEMTRIALTAALEEAERISTEELAKVTGGLDLPGLQ